MLMDGGVRSTLIPDTTTGPPTSPALLVHVPEALCPSPSDRTIGESQLKMPDTPSVPANVTVTAFLRQPAELAAGFAEAVTRGDVASRLMVIEAEPVPAEFFAVQVKVWPLVSEVMVRAAQPDCEVTLLPELIVHVRDT